MGSNSHLQENTSSYIDYGNTYVGTFGAFLGIEMVLGFALNLCILVLNFVFRKKTKMTTGHLLISNLHVMDIVICVTAIPLTLGTVTTGRKKAVLVCVAQESFLSLASAGSSAALLVVTFDRYDTLINPFNRKLGMANIKFVITVVWMLALTASLIPFSVLINMKLTEALQTKLPCFVWFINSAVGFYFTMFYVVLYFTANVIMIVCYQRIWKVARTRINVKTALVGASIIGKEDSYKSLNRQRERKVTLMCFNVVLVFMICWGPHTLLSITLMTVRKVSTHWEMAYLSVLCLAYLTTCLHPLVYAVMRKKFRETISAAWSGQQHIVAVGPDPAIASIQASDRVGSKESSGRPKHTQPTNIG